ncbi:hypothetical protein JYT60_00995 [bacterium AH-315-C08]|nr:hypothetical protein [bacterium AH-315-C08]
MKCSKQARRVIANDQRECGDPDRSYPFIGFLALQGRKSESPQSFVWIASSLTLIAMTKNGAKHMQYGPKFFQIQFIFQNIS